MSMAQRKSKYMWGTDPQGTTWSKGMHQPALSSLLLLLSARLLLFYYFFFFLFFFFLFFFFFFFFFASLLHLIRFLRVVATLLLFGDFVPGFILFALIGSVCACHSAVGSCCRWIQVWLSHAAINGMAKGRWTWSPTIRSYLAHQDQEKIKLSRSVPHLHPKTKRGVCERGQETRGLGRKKTAVS